MGVPITHDEALTVMKYVPDSYWNIINNNNWPTANNHILHTLFTKILSGVFGDGIFIVRLPALIAQLLFLFFSYRIIRHLIPDPLWVMATFLLLNLHPLLFEFWGLSRGYALSLAMMMGSIYYLCCVISGARPWYLWISLLFAVLAVYSNFVLLNFYLALCAVIVLGFTQTRLINRLLPIGFFSLVLLALIIGPIRQLKKHDQFYFGGENGFVRDTIGTLLRETFFVDNTANMLPAAWAIVIIVLLFGIYWFTQRLKTNSKETNQGLVLWSLLIIPAASTVAQHLLLGNKFLIERTALFFIPLFMLQLVYALYNIGKGKAATISVWLIAVLAVVNFSYHFSFVASRLWNYDRYNLLILDRMIKNNPKDKLTIKVYWPFTPSFQYYIAHQYRDRIHQIESNRTYTTTDTLPDYFYIHLDDLPDIAPIYAVDTSFMDGKYILLKKR